MHVPFGWVTKAKGPFHHLLTLEKDIFDSTPHSYVSPGHVYDIGLQLQNVCSIAMRGSKQKWHSLFCRLSLSANASWSSSIYLIASSMTVTWNTNMTGYRYRPTI